MATYLIAFLNNYKGKDSLAHKRDENVLSDTQCVKIVE